MSDELGLLVKFKAEYDSVTKGFNEIAKGTDKLVAGNKQAAGSFDELGSKAKESADKVLNGWLGIGVALSSAGLTVFFNKTASAIDHLTDTARGLGVAASDFQKLSYGAALGGVGMDELGDSLKKFNITLGQALSGNEDVIASFKNLGVSVEKLRGKDLATQYATVADAASKVKDKNIAASNAMQIFGKSYTSSLSLGRDGLQQNIKEFDSLGVTLTKSQREAVDAFGDSKTKLDTLFNGFVQKVVASTAPAFAALINGVSDFVQASGGIEGLATNVGNKIVSIVQASIDTFNAIKPAFQFLLDTLGVFIDQSKTVFNSAKQVANTFSDNVSNGSTAAHRDAPGVGDFLYDLFGLGRNGSVAKSVDNFYHPYDVSPDGFENSHISDTVYGNRRSPQGAIAGQSFIPSANLSSISQASQSRTNPYSNAAVIATQSAFKTATEKATKSLTTWDDAIQKSSDLITAGFKALDGKDLGDAINRIMGLIQSKGEQSQASYDEDTKSGLDKISKQGGNVEQFNLNRALNRPNDPIPATSNEFDELAAGLLKDLKEGLVGKGYQDSLRNLTLQSRVDLQSGRGSADQKVIEEIQKYATSLGANKQQVEVGITVTPTKDFAVKVFTDVDALPYLAAAVSGVAAEAATQGAKT